MHVCVIVFSIEAYLGLGQVFDQMNEYINIHNLSDMALKLIAIDK